MKLFEILSAMETVWKKLVDGRRSERVRNLRRLERAAARMHREITGAKLRRLERFSDTELLEALSGDSCANVRQRLFASERVFPYARLLYWLWLYTEQRDIDNRERTPVDD